MLMVYVEMVRLAQKKHGEMKDEVKAADMRKDAVLPEENTAIHKIFYLKTGLVYKMKRSLKQNTDGF